MYVKMLDMEDTHLNSMFCVTLSQILGGLREKSHHSSERLEMDELRDYWREVSEAPSIPPHQLDHTSLQEASVPWEEGEQEEAWLLAAGLPHLTGPWRAGRELSGAELAQALRRLPPHQADAVRRRVASLNHTIARRRARPGRHARNTPHIRDVFSTPAPSTSLPAIASSLPASLTTDHTGVSIMSLPPSRPPARRAISANTTDTTDTSARFDLFGPGQAREVAGDSEGVLIVGYQRLGTLTPRSRERRSGSDPTSECGSLRIKSGGEAAVRIASEALSPVRRASSQGHLASEEAKLAVESEWLRWANSDEAAVESRLGRSCFEALGDEDRTRLHPLLLLEVSALLDQVGAPGPKLKPAKKKRRDESSNTAVFGISLTSLLERDRQVAGCSDLQVPLVLHKILQLLERESCLREEGLLRVPGSRARAEAAAAALQSDFYGPQREEKALRALESLGAHELGALLKRLLRELPSPLLTTPLIDCFYQCHALHSEEDQLRGLRLLALLLPNEERHVLRVLLEFLARVAEQEAHNKMSLHNVAMIFAPNLFPPTWLHKTSAVDSEEHLQQQVEVAAQSCRLVQLMVKAGPQLWSVPPGLVRQLRQQYEAERFQGAPHALKENSKPMRKLLGRRPPPREAIVRVVENEVDFQEGKLRVQAPQFQLTEVPVQLSEDTSAGDVLLRLVEQSAAQADSDSTCAGGQHLKLRRQGQDARQRALCELARNGNLSCLLASADPNTALQTHSLYERGGNIGQRQIEHNARLLAVYRENPNAQWIVVCHHRNGLPLS